VFQFWGDVKPTRTDPPRDGINIELNYYRRIQVLDENLAVNSKTRFL
jgi:hypothetical protein